MIATKRQVTAWASLKNRTDREEQGLFLVEGSKLVAEVIASGWEIVAQLRLADPETPPSLRESEFELTAEQMQRVSSFRTAPRQIAVVRRPPALAPSREPTGLCLALDGLQDPGNLGTILRTAEWFGIRTIYCSTDTVDCFHPRVLQATMGAFLRLQTFVVDLPDFLRSLPPTLPRWGTVLDGANLFQTPLTPQGLLVLGNEGHGLSPAVEQALTHRLTIPRWGEAGESLNVASAAAILCAEFRRSMV